MNLKKTKYIIFGNRKVDICTKLKINKIEIERVSNIKFLGVNIDEKLSWKLHVNYLKSKIAKTIGVLCKIKHSVNQKSLQLLYNTLILPYYNYCSEIWGTSPKSTLQPIFLLQKKVIRIINGVDYYAPTNPLFIKLNILKLHNLVELNIVALMYKVHNNMLPKCLQERFKPRETQYSLRGTDIYQTNRARTNTKLSCISITGVNLWNNLDKRMKQATSIKIFKKMFKSKVLDDYRTIK